MKKYSFFDTDHTCEAELDITGAHYNTLMEVCFRYCTCVAFRIHPKIKFPACLAVHRLPVNNAVSALYDQLGKMGIHTESGVLLYETGVFQLTEEVKYYILHASNSLFGWIDENPEDIAFFRADGSVFLHTSTHNGICMLTPRDAENVDIVLSNDPWTVSNQQPTFYTPTIEN